MSYAVADLRQPHRPLSTVRHATRTDAERQLAEVLERVGDHPNYRDVRRHLGVAEFDDIPTVGEVAA